MDPIKAAPGGQIPVKYIVGRDDFVAILWRILDHSSIRLEAERRIGKTHILDKMAAEPPAGWEPILLDLEQVHSAAEFAELVCKKVDDRLQGWSKQGRRVAALLDMLRGVSAGPIKFPDKEQRPDGYWKKLLVSAIEDLVEQQGAVGKRVVFLFDEMPWMIAAIADPGRDGEQTAMEVLDVLRSLRQSPVTGPGFRMVLCGSIGLHHVLGSLKKSGYKNQAVNDMRLVEVPPLASDIAAELADALLRGEALKAGETAPAAIAAHSGGFPYYIHWIVSQLAMSDLPVTLERIELVVRELLTAPHDPCNFLHFKSRIEGYYTPDHRVAMALLDHAAAASAPLAQAELVNVARSVCQIEDERVRELLRLLAVDHYLIRDTEGHYAFRHALLRRWWILEQGLVLP